MKTGFFALAAALIVAGFASGTLVDSGQSTAPAAAITAATFAPGAASAATFAQGAASTATFPPASDDIATSAPASDGIVTFSPDRSHSRVGFKVRHLGISHVRGSFREYDAVVKFDPADLSTLSANATVQTSSIDTDQERRDNHLRSDDFFSAERYPELTFVSTGVRKIDGNQFELVGDLTIRDVTKEVVFNTEFIGVGAGRRGMKAGFEARTTINRFDYGLKWDRLTEAGGLVVSEDVEILLEMELDEVLPEG